MRLDRDAETRTHDDRQLQYPAALMHATGIHDQLGRGTIWPELGAEEIKYGASPPLPQFPPDVPSVLSLMPTAFL